MIPNTVHNIKYGCEVPCPLWAKPYIDQQAEAFFVRDEPLPWDIVKIDEGQLLKVEKFYYPHPILTFISYKIPMDNNDTWGQWIIVAVACGAKT